MSYAHELAAKMMIGPVPAEILRRLDRIEELARPADGRLMSRQVVAAVILAWELEQRGQQSK